MLRNLTDLIHHRNAEFLPLLYESNVFRIHSAPTLLEFSKSLPPLALSSIRRISVVIFNETSNFASDTKPIVPWLNYWDSLCSSLSNLSSLRALFIEFYLSEHYLSSPWDEAESVAFEVLEPLTAVCQKSLRKFEVKGNWDEMRAAAMVSCAGLEDAPFKVFGQDHLFEPLLQTRRFEEERT